VPATLLAGTGQLKCDTTRAETRFRLSTKRTSPFKSARGRQFSRLLAAEVCASAVVMLNTPRSEVVWRVLVTHSIRQFPLHFPSHASPCTITFQQESTPKDSSRRHQTILSLCPTWCRVISPIYVKLSQVTSHSEVLHNSVCIFFHLAQSSHVWH